MRHPMAEIGRPERVIEVHPAEEPVPGELPIEPSEPAPREPAPREDPVPA
jgi:hypothetical protein